MAPKVAKRPAAVSVGGAKKAARNQVSSQCKDVEMSLKTASGLSDSLRSMLVASVAPALSQYQDLRHEHQTKVVGWIDEALAAHQIHLENGVAQVKVTADAAAAEVGTCQAAVGAAEESLARLSETAAGAESTDSAARSEVDALTSALEASKDAAVALDKETNVATAQKQTLEAIVSEKETSWYAKMKVEVSKKKDADAFVKSLKKLKLEATLLQTLAPVLVKEPATRTEFDSLVLKQFEEVIAGQIAAQAQVIEEAAPAKQERAAAAAAAQAALDTAKAAAESTDAALKEAQAAVKQGEAALKDATKSVKACGPATKAALSAAKEAESALQEFVAGPTAVFKELRDRCTPVEEPAVAEDAPPAPPADDQVPQATDV